ncbi:hypothetical protein ACFL4A_02095, partial [bacterium]
FVKKDTMIVNMQADRVDIDDKNRLIEANGNVKVLKDKGEYEVVGEKGIYSEEDNYLIFTDTPVVTQVHDKGKAYYKGERIIFYPMTNKIIIKDRVEIEFHPNEKILEASEGEENETKSE